MKEKSGIKKVIEKAALNANRTREKDMSEVFGTKQRIRDKVIDTVKSRVELMEKLEKFSRAQDIFSDFTTDAAKCLVIEMFHGATSNDRRKAAEALLDRELGKPMQRQMNLNMSVHDKTNKEVDYEIENLMGELGYKKKEGRGLLLDEGDGGRAQKERDVTQEAPGEEELPGPDEAIEVQT